MTLPLFAEPVADDEGYGPCRGSSFDGINAAARKKLDAPAGWRFYKWEVLERKNPNSPYLVEGAVPIGTTKKGLPKWPSGDGDKCVIYDADIEAAKLEYERETGRCAECVEGWAFAGWHHQKGYKYKPCPRCAGSGRMPLSVLPHDSGEKA